MIAMPKENMIQYLKDYANVQYIAMQNPNIPIGKIFDKYMIENSRYEDDTREYYDIMRKVYSAYIYFKMFSITEDFLLNRDDFLSNNDLNGLEQGCIFYTDANGITNKKMVQLIRDAFNHNDSSDFDRFKISVNGRYFEIEFKDVRTQKERIKNVPTKSFKIKFNIDYLVNVNRIINIKRQNELFLSFDIPADFDIYAENLDVELDKISFIHYYFEKKLSRETIEQFNRLMNTNGLSNDELLERSKEIHLFAKNLNVPVEYHLTDEQKVKIKSLIERYRKFYPDFLNDDINAVMYYFLSKVIPIPAFKQMEIENQLLISDGYLLDVNLSVNEILKRISCIINDEDKSKTYDNIDIAIHDELANKSKAFQVRLYKNVLDGEFMQGFPIIIYIDSVVMHYCSDEEICINGVNYSKEKIRNSFAHGRWYISANKELVMFDADPKNVNDYNLEFIGKIDIGDFEEWADNYMEQHKKNFGR